MKCFSGLTPVLSLIAVQAIPMAYGHYVFSKFIVDGQMSSDFEYIRYNSNNYMPTLAPNILNDDFRCNQDSMSSAADTKVYTVAPGATLGFQLAYGATMRHPGPLQVYMSKAPSDVRKYDGSGDWFLVYQLGVCQDISDGLKDTDWCTWDKDTINFPLPANTPPGEYLVRVEHIALHGAHVGSAEFYFTCAQVNITGNGNGIPGPLVKIPGVYSPTDPGIAFNIYSGPTSYGLPGPTLWTGSVGFNGTITTQSSSTEPNETTTTLATASDPSLESNHNDGINGSITTLSSSTGPNATTTTLSPTSHPSPESHDKDGTTTPLSSSGFNEINGKATPSPSAGISKSKQKCSGRPRIHGKHRVHA